MILNTGDIANLYENEERLEIIEKVRVNRLRNFKLAVTSVRSCTRLCVYTGSSLL